MRRPDPIDIVHVVGLTIAHAGVMFFVVAVAAFWCGIISGRI